MDDIKRQSFRYFRQQLQIVVVLSLVGLLVMQIWHLDTLLVPIIVSAVFMLVVSSVYGKLWSVVATKSPDNLTTFYSATSGFRMLLALMTMGVYYLVPGRGTMLIFVLVFMAFYMICLAHHTIFFARLTNRS